jgi:hypothetical protein
MSSNHHHPRLIDRKNALDEIALLEKGLVVLVLPSRNQGERYGHATNLEGHGDRIRSNLVKQMDVHPAHFMIYESRFC